ncbi:MAG: hypothetical protein SCJ94_11595 [Bacillota bacterium]|nr:hypothetical protein [Bacillota bacterium]MDW7730628.1 hypothetical protein [Bacillota bacterium]
MFRSGGLFPENKDSVPLEAWTHDDRNYKILVEDSLYMPHLNSVLTILTIPYDEYDEEDDEIFY